MAKERRGKKTKLLAVDLGRKSLRGENDFLKEKKITTSSLNHHPFVRFKLK